MSNTQTESITWHKYPKEKPAKKNYYLVHVQGMGEKWFTTDEWYHNEWVVHPYDEIIAWTELPKGWKDA